jgi:hypothetical protein
MARYQRGHIYRAFGAFHVRFYQTEIRDAELVRESKRLRGSRNRESSHGATSQLFRNVLSCRMFQEAARASTKKTS